MPRWPWPWPSGRSTSAAAGDLGHRLRERPARRLRGSAGLSLDASVLELVFGVALVAYFGHTSAGHSAKVVLARDPSGRHLLAGNIAAMLSAMAIYVVFVLVVTGAVGATELAGYTGTA